MTPLDPEVVVCTPSKDAAQRVLSYMPNSQQTSFGLDGEQVPRQTLWTPEIRNPADVFDEELYIVEPNAMGWQYMVHFSRRCGMITRLQVAMPGRATFVDILRRVDTGQALGCAERYRFDMITDRESEFNPTMGGAIDPEFGAWPTTVRHLHGSPLLRRKVEQQGSDFRIDSSTIPIHFGDEYGRRTPPTWNHGGDQWHPVLMPRFEQGCSFHINPAHIAVTYRGWCPVKIPKDSKTGVLANTSMWLIGPGDPPLFVVPGEPTRRFDCESLWDLNNSRMNFDLTFKDLRVNGVPQASILPPSVDSSLVASISRTPREGYPVIGQVAKIRRDDALGAWPNEISVSNQMSSNWGRTGVPDYDRNAGRRISVRSRGNGRIAGARYISVIYVLGESVQQVEQALHSAVNELKEALP